MKLIQIKRLYTEFGPEIAFSAAGASRFRSMAPWKHRCILRYLREKYGDLISRYRQSQPWEKNDSVSQVPATIWTLWWQGEDNLPEIVKLCHASVRRHCGAHPFKVLTRDNYQDYVTLPGYIMDKVQSGAITITHLSDIIRFALLSQRSGLWLDSTIFVAGTIPEEIFASEYYTVRRPLRQKTRNVAQERWTGFLQAAHKDNILCRFVFELLMNYWKNQKYLLDYFMVDYNIELAREDLQECQQLLDSVPLNNLHIEDLPSLLNSKWDPATFIDMTSDTLFFKLTWKRQFERTLRGQETFYGHLLKEYQISEMSGDMIN